MQPVRDDKKPYGIILVFIVLFKIQLYPNLRSIRNTLLRNNDVTYTNQ